MGWNKRAIGICYVGGLDKTLGVSNHFTGEPAHISVRDGSLLVIWDKTAGFPVTEQ